MSAVEAGGDATRSSFGQLHSSNNPIWEYIVVPPPPTELGKELVQCEHNSCVVCSVYDNDIVSRGVMSLFIAKRSFFTSRLSRRLVYQCIIPGFIF